ncbi:MAG TPA: alpha/beta hydrolase, partial [Chitinophagaceae bacterium]|nr:alpha/beta hydrolase [Chitinophagaceae bacterium]
QGQKASWAFMDRPEVIQELDKYGLNRKTPALSSRQETIRFRINTFAKRMLYDINKWPDIMGGRALYKGHVFELTAKTYPASGWDYLQEFKKQAYPVNVIIGDHDFLDFGNHLIKKWVNEVPRIKLSVIKNAGHLLWLDQPKEFTNQLGMALRR